MSARSRGPRAGARGGPAQRIQKALAEAGIGSRRQVEGWIREGRISVNGRPARIGEKLSPGDRVRFGPRVITIAAAAPSAARVLAYKKRAGEVVTRSDPDGRRTVFRKLPRLERGRWIAVGRLDLNTSGLLLLTDSGELARRLMHPAFRIEREYAVRVHGALDAGLLERLRTGVRLEDGIGRFEALEAVEGSPVAEAGGPANRWFRVTVREGRHRLVRRLWESQGCQVSRLIRVRFGPVELGRGVRSGGFRELEPGEVARLAAAVELDSRRSAGPK